MLHIGLIREGKIPADNRVALTPAQCKWLCKHFDDVRVTVQRSDNRCYPDKEYLQAGMEVKEDISECNVLLGIKEVPVEMLIDGKTYLFFSHTKKMQPHNRQLFKYFSITSRATCLSELLSSAKCCSMRLRTVMWYPTHHQQRV